MIENAYTKAGNISIPTETATWLASHSNTMANAEAHIQVQLMLASSPAIFGKVCQQPTYDSP